MSPRCVWRRAISEKGQVRKIKSIDIFKNRNISISIPLTRGASSETFEGRSGMRRPCGRGLTWLAHSGSPGPRPTVTTGRALGASWTCGATSAPYRKRGPGISGKSQVAPARTPRWSAERRACPAGHALTLRREEPRASLGAPSPSMLVEGFPDDASGAHAPRERTGTSHAV
jgi:hypothetical protein